MGQYDFIRNKFMKHKFEMGEAVDVSECEKNGEGDYMLSENDFKGDQVLYCDINTEEWIVSIGQSKRTHNIILASTTDKFYHDPDFSCLYLK